MAYGTRLDPFSGVFLICCVALLTAAIPLENEDVDIVLQVVTSSVEGEAVTEADGTTWVQLRALVTHAENTAALGISLFDCQATSDNTVVILTDYNGCPAYRSPLPSGCMSESDGVIMSPAFPLSSLADRGDVNITCAWDTCPEHPHPKCQDRCSFFNLDSGLHDGPDQRRTGGIPHKREADKGVSGDDRPAGRRVTTTIRVIPSDVQVRRHHHGFESSGHRHDQGSRSVAGQLSHAERENQKASSGMTGGHHDNMRGGGRGEPATSALLLYLNPITCSVFLLVIVVFLALYASFVRSLRASVELLRHDVVALQGQYRDKFIVPH